MLVFIFISFGVNYVKFTTTTTIRRKTKKKCAISKICYQITFTKYCEDKLVSG